MSERPAELQSTAAMEMETSSSSYEDANPCPICLGAIIQPSYLDKCFHKFCYNCIVQWTKVVSGKRTCTLSSIKCPLCKTESFSIIHGLDGHCFQRHYVNQNFEDSFVLSKAHKFRLQCYYTEPGCLDDVFNVQRYWKLRKYLQENQWLEVWLKRELQALIQEEDVDIIMHHLLGLITPLFSRNEPRYQPETPESKRERFSSMVCDAAKPFLLARTNRFVLELELFLASGLNIEAYDSVYLQRLGWSELVVPSVGIKEDDGLNLLLHTCISLTMTLMMMNEKVGI